MRTMTLTVGCSPSLANQMLHLLTLMPADYSPSDDLADLLTRYTVACSPEYFVKLRKKCALRKMPSSCTAFGLLSHQHHPEHVCSVRAVTLGSNYCFGRRGRYVTLSVCLMLTASQRCYSG